MPWTAAVLAAMATLEHNQGLQNALANQQGLQGGYNNLQNCTATEIGLRQQEGLNNQTAYINNYLTAGQAANGQLGALLEINGNPQNVVRIDTLFSWAMLAPMGTFISENSEAKAKAEKLLLDQLDEKQRAEYKASQQFHVKSCNGKTYKITRQRSFNVTGPQGECYCGQTPDTPIEDQMLAQKLLLEHDPERLFKNSNKLAATGAYQPQFIGIDWGLDTTPEPDPPRRFNFPINLVPGHSW